MTLLVFCFSRFSSSDDSVYLPSTTLVEYALLRLLGASSLLQKCAGFSVSAYWYPLACVKELSYNVSQVTTEQRLDKKLAIRMFADVSLLRNEIVWELYVECLSLLSKQLLSTGVVGIAM